MVINTNATAELSSSYLAQSSKKLAQSIEALSSGSKLNSPANDPAGLAQSIKFTSQISDTNAANANVGNAVSLSQTQDGYLQQIQGALSRMSELSVLSQDVTKTDSDRSLYDKEFQTLGSYITNTASKDFNGVSLFSASALAVTVDGKGGTFSMAGIDLTASAYTGATGSNVATTAGATAALTAVTTAINQLATDRATVGANEARLNYTSSQLGTLSDNLTAAKSAIADVDVAKESTNYQKYNILVQSGTAMLAQANTAPQSVLRLLQ